MSKPDVWMPFYVADYLADTGRLTTEQHGAYLLLILDYWRNGPLPADDSALAQITRLPIAAWRKCKQAVMAFFRLEENVWRHKRIDAELENATKHAERRASRASKAASARWSEHATSIAQSNAPSIEQALLNECSSPSPSPIPPISTTSVVEITPPTKSGSEKSHGSRLPSDWQPTEAEAAYAREQGLDPDRETVEFREYWLARSGAAARKADWHLTWQTWCRRSAEFAKARASPGNPRFDINDLLNGKGQKRDS